MKLLLALLSVSWAAPVRVQLPRAPLSAPALAAPLSPSALVGAALQLPGQVPALAPSSRFIAPTLSPSLFAAPIAPLAPRALPPANEPMAQAPAAQDIHPLAQPLAAALPAQAANDASFEQRSADASKSFDNAKPKDEAVRPPGGGSVPPSDGVPSYLSVPNPEDRPWAAAVFKAAMESPTGRKVLARIEKLTREQGRPLTLVVLDLRSNNGEYVYDWEVVRMASRYRKLDPQLAAPIVVHELLHVAQKADGLPVDAVEMELEAHLITLRVIRELGVPLMPGSFEEGAHKALKKSAAKFVQYVVDAYDNNRPLGQGGLKAYVKWVEESRAKAAKRVAKLEKRLARERGIVDAMKDSGQPAEMISKYEREVVGDLELKLLIERNGLAWNERDLRILATPEGAARYRSFAARVRRMIREGRSALIKP